MSNLVSIIIPCYNYGKYLEECVKSVINNITDIAYEIIIVDDASTDNSLVIAKGLEQTIKNCKVIHNETNKKAAYSRNLGIKNSIGDYIICLDADDKLPSNYIQENLKNIIDNNVDISYNNINCFELSNKIWNWNEFNKEELRRFNYIHVTSMFKRKIWETLNGYDESFVYGLSDYDFWLRAFKSEFKFKKCNETFLWYRIHGKSNTDLVTNKYRELIREKLREKHGNFDL